MSSRGQHVGSSPASGLYQAKNTPEDAEDLPVYLNDELLAIGGIINGILEGGAFPPTSVMPKRFKEGMMVYFTSSLPGTEILSAGIWLYRGGKWWKLVDDPSSFAGNTFIYKKTATDVPPSKPQPGQLPIAGWSEQPPQRVKSEFIWMCKSILFNDLSEVHTWSEVSMWAAGVEDGLPGAPGIPGNDGYDGIRGNITITDETPRTSFDATAAYLLVVDEVQGRNPAQPINGDIVQQQGADFVERRSYQVGSGFPGIWELVEEFIDGNLVVHGTINGEAIRSNSQIRIGGNKGQDLVVLDANDPSARIWVGSSYPDASAKFLVDPEGNMTCRDADIRGTLFADDIGGNGNGVIEGVHNTISTVLNLTGGVDDVEIATVNFSDSPYDRLFTIDGIRAQVVLDAGSPVPNNWGKVQLNTTAQNNVVDVRGESVPIYFNQWAQVAAGLKHYDVYLPTILTHVPAGHTSLTIRGEVRQLGATGTMTFTASTLGTPYTGGLVVSKNRISNDVTAT